MPVPVTLPRLGWSMEEGVFVGWLKADGDVVRAGEPLFELEGEKALQQIEALDDGVLHIAAGCPAPGSTAKVGALLGHLCRPGERPPAEPASPVARESSAEPAVGPAAGPAATVRPETSAPAPPHRSTGALPPLTPRRPAQRARRTAAAATRTNGRGAPRATPRARRAARRAGVDLSGLAGTGRDGRILERDVLAAAASSGASSSTSSGAGATSASGGRWSSRPVPTSGGRLERLSPARRTIASRMSAGAHEAAPVTLVRRIDAANLVGLRRQLQAASSGDSPPPSYTDLIVKLAAVALGRHPRLNALWTDDGVWLADAVDLGIAVDTPHGLVVPVVRNVPNLTLRELAAASRDLAGRARERRLSVEEQSGGTFTVTNLGMFGVDAFTPILNPPQVAILGVGRIVREPIVQADRLAVGESLTLSLTFDHRALDGADAARFLADLALGLENPAAWLVG